MPSFNHFDKTTLMQDLIFGLCLSTLTFCLITRLWHPNRPPDVTEQTIPTHPLHYLAPIISKPPCPLSYIINQLPENSFVTSKKNKIWHSHSLLFYQQLIKLFHILSTIHCDPFIQSVTITPPSSEFSPRLLLILEGKIL